LNPLLRLRKLTHAVIDALSITTALLIALAMIPTSSFLASAADPPKSRLESLKEREERDSANEAYWRGQHRKVLKRQEKAELEVERTSEEYSRARRLRRNRGGPSDAARKARDDAREELKAANAAREKFLDDARRGGAKPGWLRIKD
jgi:hypothetical protein